MTAIVVQPGEGASVPISRAGPAGKGWKFGSGAPAAEIGRIGEMYLDLDTFDVYGPKVGASWPAEPVAHLKEAADLVLDAQEAIEQIAVQVAQSAQLADGYATSANAAKNTAAAYRNDVVEAAAAIGTAVEDVEELAEQVAGDAAAAAASASKLVATSTTSRTLGLGAKVFDTQTGKLFAAGNAVWVTSDSAPSTHWMTGLVTSYVGDDLTIDVTSFSGSGARADWTIRVSGAPGANGLSGWTPELATVEDGEREVLQVIDWFGGTGTKPDLGMYLGAGGFVVDIEDARNVRGGGAKGWTPKLAVVPDGIRYVQQVVDWFGGEGVKPPTGEYLGPSGHVTDIAEASNIRGAPGLGSGDMTKSVYDTDNDGKVDAAETADSVLWAGIPDKPAFDTAALQPASAFATSAQGALATNAMPKTGGAFTGAILLSSDGSTSMHPVSYQQFQSGLLSLGRRGQVRVATAANITISTALNSGDSLDGVTLATGDLVLVKNQSTASQNGIYIVGTSPARSAEFDTYDEHAGVTLAVQEGTQADTLWLCTSNRGGTLGSTAIAFAPLPVSSNTVNASLTLTGLQLSINFANANTWTAKQTMAASASGGAMFRLTPGVAPTSPADGDAWTTAAGFFVRINGVTIGPLSAIRESFVAITSAASPYAAVAFRTILCTSGAITVNLPASPATGDEVVVIRYGSDPVTVGRNTKTISGAAEDFVIDVDKRSATFVYSGSTWVVAGGSIA